MLNQPVVHTRISFTLTFLQSCHSSAVSSFNDRNHDCGEDVYARNYVVVCGVLNIFSVITDYDHVFYVGTPRM